MHLGIITNINRTKSNQLLVPFNGGEPGLSGSIRMEGMQDFANKTSILDGQGISHKYYS